MALFAKTFKTMIALFCTVFAAQISLASELYLKFHPIEAQQTRQGRVANGYSIHGSNSIWVDITKRKFVPESMDFDLSHLKSDELYKMGLSGANNKLACHNWRDMRAYLGSTNETLGGENPVTMSPDEIKLSGDRQNWLSVAFKEDVPTGRLLSDTSLIVTQNTELGAVYFKNPIRKHWEGLRLSGHCAEVSDYVAHMRVAILRNIDDGADSNIQRKGADQLFYENYVPTELAIFKKDYNNNSSELLGFFEHNSLPKLAIRFKMNCRGKWYKDLGVDNNFRDEKLQLDCEAVRESSILGRMTFFLR
ncbi:MAG: hypothetical protein COT74_09795 [Bdellovibrionales bacterium CG10_big_fil_rev_8_21_14_0_10_45_34]|nr:MAG: hypothetical protein COT74_09795 [Bdellovibrionales bacterium CG10_big_fil_rev_8_21_14_0_10_45_34]